MIMGLSPHPVRVWGPEDLDMHLMVKSISFRNRDGLHRHATAKSVPAVGEGTTGSGTSTGTLPHALLAAYVRLLASGNGIWGWLRRPPFGPQKANTKQSPQCFTVVGNIKESIPPALRYAPSISQQSFLLDAPLLVAL